MRRLDEGQEVVSEEKIELQENAMGDEVISVKQKKLNLKNKIMQNRQTIKNNKIKDFYREKKLNLSHINLKKGVDLEEATSKKGI
jgi:hypothetical protein